MIRRTAIGFAIGATIFGSLGVMLNREIGAPPFANLGPLAILALIGGTTAGLISPMFRRRRSGRRAAAAHRAERARGTEPSGSSEGREEASTGPGGPDGPAPRPDP